MQGPHLQDPWANPHSEETFLDWDQVKPDSHLGEILIIWTLEGPALLVLALYLDQVLITNFGVPRHPLFCLGYTYSSSSSVLLDSEAVAGEPGKGQDVEEEEARVRAMVGEAKSRQDVICIEQLEKMYPGPPEKHAVRGLTLGIKRGECFGMLGPNGAGKTTTINMLIGLDTPTRGNALVEGFSILSHVDRIYSILGVCPQDNLLWPTLTAREHLTFYGTLKNLTGAALKADIERCLKAVNLLGVIDQRASSFSGGMKRRLSVAIALIGDPLVLRPPPVLPMHLLSHT